jgi:hypothetical protein
MKKNTIYRVSAIIMAVLVTLSSFNISVDFHYCKDVIKSVSFFGKAKNCKEISTRINCTINEKKSSQIKRSKCCHNESIVISNLDTETTFSQSIIDSENIIKWISVLNSPFLLPLTTGSKYKNYFSYKPPLLDKNRSILYQAFLL